MLVVEKTKELIVTVPHRVGALAQLLETIANSAVNVVALCGKVKGRAGVIRIVVTDCAKAQKAIKKAGFKVETNNVLIIQMDDRLGTGAVLANALAQAGVNIIDTYAAGGAGKVVAVINVDKPAFAFKALKAAG